MILKIFKYYTKNIFVFFVLSASVFSQIKVVCIGNSITAGYGLSNRDTESYPAQLQQILGSGYDVDNYGYPGTVLLNNFSKSYVNSPSFIPSISQHYDIIIITLGTNDTQYAYHDSIKNFISDYISLINAYDNDPSVEPPICIVGIPPPMYLISDLYRQTYLIEQIIPKIQSVASQTNNSIINFYNALQDKEYLFLDGIHPNVGGAYIMAITAKSAIDKALSPPPSTPSNFSADGEDGQVTLTWDANSEIDLANYSIYRGIIDGGWKDLLVILDKNMTSFVDKTVNNHIPYYYQISAQNTYNKVSARSNQISVTPGGIPDTTPPSIPNNLTAIASQGVITLSWNPNIESDLECYNIYRGINDGGWMDYLTTVDAMNTSFEDKDIDENTTYFYRIDAQDNSGNTSDRSNQINATTLNLIKNSTFVNFSLYQNTPNPFNPYTTIEYSIPKFCYGTVTIYDLLGSEIRLLINDYHQLGHHSVNWDGTDNSGNTVCCGTYLYQINIDNFTQTKKMILLK